MTAECGSALYYIQGKNFPGFTLRNDFEWTATDFAVGDEPLGTNTGVDQQFKGLPAIGAHDDA